MTILGLWAGWQRWGAGGAAGGPGQLQEAKGFGAPCFNELRAAGDLGEVFEILFKK